MRNPITKSPTSHGIGLRECENTDDSVPINETGDAWRRPASTNQNLVIALIRDHPQVVTRGDRGEPCQDLIVVNRACRIVGAIYEEDFRFRGYQRLELVKIRYESITRLASVANFLAAQPHRHDGCIRPAGIG